MDKVLEEYSASALRWHLIEAIKQFIVCLGNSSVEDLAEMREYSRHILNLLKEIKT